MAGAFFSQASGLLYDWAVASFVSASLDWFFGLHTSNSHLLNVFSAILQFTTVTFACHQFVYAFGLRQPTNTIQNTWIMYQAVWHMSPNAVKKLVDAYYAFHRLLYGADSMPTEQTSE